MDILESLLWELPGNDSLSSNVRFFLECHIESIESVLSLESISILSIELEIIRKNLSGVNIPGPTVEEITSRISVLWILLNGERLGFNNGEVKIEDIDIQRYHDIYSITLDQPLSTLFLIGKSIGVLGSTETAEAENELKLLDTSYEECKESLDSWKKQNTSLEVIENRACNIVDELYDDVNLRLDRQALSNGGKRSCRIRKKIYSDDEVECLYTLKRKYKKEKNESGKKIQRRKSDEKESSILEPKIFLDMISGIGFKKTRTKRKYRRSFSISYFDEELNKKIDAQIDIDKYDHKNIPEFVEIECHDDEAIDNIIKHLGFENKTVFTKGSRGLYRKYEVYDEYEREYVVDEITGEVKWQDGSTGNIHMNTLLQIPE